GEGDRDPEPQRRLLPASGTRGRYALRSQGGYGRNRRAQRRREEHSGQSHARARAETTRRGRGPRPPGRPAGAAVGRLRAPTRGCRLELPGKRLRRCNDGAGSLHEAPPAARAPRQGAGVGGFEDRGDGEVRRYAHRGVLRWAAAAYLPGAGSGPGGGGAAVRRAGIRSGCSFPARDIRSPARAAADGQDRDRDHPRPLVRRRALRPGTALEQAHRRLRAPGGGIHAGALERDLPEPPHDPQGRGPYGRHRGREAGWL
ncbi:MAG: Manganese ABC transporter, ATP-binding protein SitB, partial [uncultured Rubrobacteraceae bacterium]